MKLAFLRSIILITAAMTSLVKGADVADAIVSEKDLTNVVLQLNNPTTQMPALRKLIEFSGMFLYNDGGSIRLSTGDQASDELRRQAAQAVHSQNNLDTVRRALSDNDLGVRLWGVMSFEFIFGKRDPWKPLLPRLEEIASHDENSGIRREAIRKLWYYDQAAAFLTSLQKSTNETDPFVLMTLLQFDSQKPESRADWYARAVKYLSGQDEALRSGWLSYIVSNVSNPATAPMWRIEADPGLVASLRQIEKTGPQKDQELAGKAMHSSVFGDNLPILNSSAKTGEN